MVGLLDTAWLFFSSVSVPIVSGRGGMGGAVAGPVCLARDVFGLKCLVLAMDKVRVCASQM